MLAILRHRNFALLWFGGLISLTGDWVLYAALPFYVYQQTKSTMATAILVASELVPLLLFGSVAGVFVDRWDRKRIMVVANFVQTAVVLLLMLVQVREWLWVVYVVSFIQTTVTTFFGPAEDALLPRLVGEEHLLAANSMNALNNNIARLVGPPIGGALLAVFGLAGVVVADSVSFLAAGVMIALITVHGRPLREAVVAARVAGGKLGQFWEEWLEGLRLIRRERAIAVVIMVFVIMSFGGVMLDPLYPAFVEHVLNAGPQGFGWLLTIQAVGGIIGGILVTRFAKNLPVVGVIGWGSVIAGALLLVKYNVPIFAVTMVISFVGGLPSAANRATTQTLFMRIVPNEYMGRASGTLGTITGLLSLVSVLGLAGTLGDILGIVPMLNVASGLTLMSGVVALVMLPRAERSRREQADAAAPKASVT